MVAFLDVRDLFAGGDDDARGLVAEDEGQRRVGAVKLVQLRVADTGGELLDQDLRRSRVRQVDVVDDHGLAEFDVDSAGRLHGHGLRLLP